MFVALNIVRLVSMCINVVHENLPSFYWLPKLHKNRYGQRFIAASNKCTTKSLSKLLTTCLAKITYHFKKYCSGGFSHGSKGSMEPPFLPDNLGVI